LTLYADIQFALHHETWPLAKVFTISRGSKTAADVIVVSLSDGNHTGRGECVPYARYGETLDSVSAQLHEAAPPVSTSISKQDLLLALPAGSARNAVDCALWDLEAKRSGQPVMSRLAIPHKPITTAYTVPYGSPDDMHATASENAYRPILKIKLASADDLNRLKAVRAAAPNAQLVVDANEGWTLKEFDGFAQHLVDAKVTVVEQPVPSSADSALKAGRYPFALCADESCHDLASLEALVGRYDMINIKLDKTGGLTEALALKSAAQSHGLQIMIGCMVGTSLSMAPAMMLAHDATLVDLDGPLLLKKDRENGIQFSGSDMQLPMPELWG
jgi:L-alanine-DL-glutamate epimerase-like enolase superfamily enzyme